MSFVEACMRCGVEPVCVSFFTTEEVFKELVCIAERNDVDVQELMRMLVDDFLINTPE